MSDDTITDIDYSSASADMVASMDNVNSRDVESAARRVITAAAEARAREFRGVRYPYVVPEVTELWQNHPEQFEPMVLPFRYMDQASGEMWLPLGGNLFDTGTACIEYGNADPTVPEETQYQWIEEKFRYFHERWPSYPAAMAEHCVTAKSSIQSGEMTAIKPVTDAVDRWAGRAQENFKEYFLDPYLVNTITNQQALLDELSVAMHAYEGILKQARIDAKNIADQTVDALEALNVGSGTSFSAVLGVVGVVVAVVSTVATAGTTTALTLGLIGAGIQAATLVADQQEVEGSYTNEVLASMTDALDKLREAMDAEEAAIADAITKTTGQVQGWLASGTPLEKATILPNEPTGDGVPNLTDGELPPPDQFHPHD